MTRAWGRTSPRWQDRPNWQANVAAFNANALARRYSSTDRIKTADVLALWERTPECVDCGHGRGLDHIVPVRLGGRNHPDNLRNLCHSCNCRRGGLASGRSRRAKRAVA